MSFFYALSTRYYPSMAYSLQHSLTPPGCPLTLVKYPLQTLWIFLPFLMPLPLPGALFPVSASRNPPRLSLPAWVLTKPSYLLCAGKCFLLPEFSSLVLMQCLFISPFPFWIQRFTRSACCWINHWKGLSIRGECYFAQETNWTKHFHEKGWAGNGR